MTQKNRPLRRVLLMAAAIPAFFGASCHELPRQVGHTVVVMEQGNLAEVAPADIAVLPVDMAPNLDAPADELRRAVAAGLPARQYTPLSIDFVDSRVMEASYSFGALGEEAVCQVTILAWDDKYWESGRSIEVDVQLSMIDPRSPDGPSLWTGRLTRTVDVSHLAQTTVEELLYDKAVELVAKDLLAALPARTVR